MDIIRQLQTSVADAFDKSFDNAYRDFNAKITLDDARVKEADKKANIAEEARKNALLEIDALKEENSLLREELCHNSIDSTDQRFSDEVFAELEQKYSPDRVLNGDLKIISGKYAELYEQVVLLFRASGDLRARVKHHKRKLEHLQLCLRRQNFVLVVDGGAVKFQRVQRAGEMPLNEETVMPINDETEGIRAPVASKSSIDHTPTDDNAKDTPKNNDDQNRKSPLTPSNNSTSSDETQSTQAPANSGIKRGALKRKHPDLPSPRDFQHPRSGEPDQSIIVKSEPVSSSPLPASSPHYGITGTQDLDEFGDTVETPRKKIQHQKAGAPIAMGSPSRRPTPPNHAFERNQHPPVWPGVLQPVDSNRKLKRFGQTGAKHPDRKTEAALAAIAEDGDENNAKFTRRESLRQLPSTHYQSREQRLQDLLERPSPTSKLLQSSKNANAPTPTRTRSGIPEKKDCFSMIRSSEQKNTADTHFNLRQPPGELKTSPDDESYRARPLHRLSLGHFKVNPDYNQGLDFAYDEVVRKKDKRKCMDGCTRPGCCGEKFRAMARFGFPSRGGDEEDRQILEEYLGSEKHLINSLSREDRQRLLEEAKAKDIANRFGKHRHQHHRAATPPGFWRTDMPGTQELERDHEEAHKIEREKVGERYREAMRPGGRWKFADE